MTAQARKISGYRLIFQRWLHKPSRSTVVLFSYLEYGGIHYIVEGYPPGSFDKSSAAEYPSVVPVHRSEHEDIHASSETVRKLFADIPQRKHAISWRTAKSA